MIEISVTKADAQAGNFETLTTGMKNAVQVHFGFSEHWDDLSKIAVFTNGIRSVNVVEANWDDDACSIPSEVLQTPWRTVRCGVYGMRGDKLILPAVMVGIGRVKPGTDPNGDPGTDPELPIWAQIDGRVTDLEKDTAAVKKSVCYTELAKNYYICGETEIHDGDQILRVFIHGLESLEGCPEIHVYRCIRRRDLRYQWTHPGNWDINLGVGNTKMGYGLIANTPYACDLTNPLYPNVPDWMPHGGFLQTVFPIDANVLRQGYIEINLRHWMLPLLKPVDPEMKWYQCGLVGVQGDGTRAPLLFQFRISRDGKTVGSSRNTLCIGLRKGSTPILDDEGKPMYGANYLSESGLIYTGHMYTSIR